MSRSLYGFLALGALAIVLTDSDPALAPPTEAEKVSESRALLPLREAREGLIVTVSEPAPAAVELAAVTVEVAPETAAEIAEPEPLPLPPPPSDTRDAFSSTWTTDQEASALDPEVQVKRIDRTHDVEAVFVLDTTGSMGWIFDTAREKALELVKALEATRAEGKTVRAALVDYKDRRRVYSSSGTFRGLNTRSHLKVTPLGSDWTALRGAFQAMGASGGGDLEEDTQGALLAALDDLSWSDGEDVTRLVYLIGDAPAKHYEDQPGLTAIGERLAAEGFRVHAFNASDPRHTHHDRVHNDWTLLSNATGGTYEVIRPTAAAGSAVPVSRPVVCRKPVPLLPSTTRPRGSAGLDLWIGPGDAEPGTPIDRYRPVEDPAPAPVAPRPRKLGGLGLEVWSEI